MRLVVEDCVKPHLEPSRVTILAQDLWAEKLAFLRPADHLRVRGFATTVNPASASEEEDHPFQIALTPHNEDLWVQVCMCISCIS